MTGGLVGAVHKAVLSDGFYRSLPVTLVTIRVLSAFTTHYLLQYQAWYSCVFLMDQQAQHMVQWLTLNTSSLRPSWWEAMIAATGPFSTFLLCTIEDTRADWSLHLWWTDHSSPGFPVLSATYLPIYLLLSTLYICLIYSSSQCT